MVRLNSRGVLVYEDEDTASTRAAELCESWDWRIVSNDGGYSISVGAHGDLLGIEGEMVPNPGRNPEVEITCRDCGYPEIVTLDEVEGRRCPNCDYTKWDIGEEYN